MSTPDPPNAADPVADERVRRQGMWQSLLDRGGPRGVSPGVLRELGVYGGAQGIWVDKARTDQVIDGGVTVAVLHTGDVYADDLTDECVLYHYPATKRPPSRDAGEVGATKAAGRLRLPVFVVTCPTPSSPVRDVRLGWVEDWDDGSRVFLIAFAERPPELPPDADDSPFALTAAGPRVERVAAARPGQVRFQFRVFRRYGPRCAVCDLAARPLLDAAHLCPKAAGGADDPRNGLVLCANHHRALDAGLFAVEPDTLAVRCRDGGPDRAALGISRDTLRHLARPPHPDAVAWVWGEWK